MLFDVAQVICLFLAAMEGTNLSGDEWAMATDSSLAVQDIDADRLLMLVGLGRTERLLRPAVPAEARGNSSQSFQWDQSLCI